jgi:hypothetical protein
MRVKIFARFVKSLFSDAIRKRRSQSYLLCSSLFFPLFREV